MTNYLSRIECPDDIKKLNFDALPSLAEEIRAFLIENILKTGGHLASNLGVVELTLALHRCFSVPRDKIIWDVGHQAYVHKIICGRRSQFDTLRCRGGISGFPKPSESEYDMFCAGHCGTSLSVALGLACAASLDGTDNHVVAVIGDASMPNGLSMEALNNIIHCKKKVIIVLNDNNMSIGLTSGALSGYLNRIRTNPKYFKAKRSSHAFFNKLPVVGKPIVKILQKSKSVLRFMVGPGIFFESLGYKYIGPVDGHDIERLCASIEEAKSINTPVIIHAITKKGKGYAPAEQMPTTYHATSPQSGSAALSTEKTSQVFGRTMVAMAEKCDRLVSISPSMPDSCGLSEFMEKYPDRFFDTGIAEAHASTFAAGLAAGGYIPVVSVYSTFLQRSYDSLIHDVALGNYHVIFAIDHAGIVGEDGETHQGVFDISYLSQIPNFTVLSPATKKELEEMLEFAVFNMHTPVAIRYPKGSLPEKDFSPFTACRASVVRGGDRVTIAAEGKMVEEAISAADILLDKGISAEVINISSIKPLDTDLLINSASKTGLIISLENNVRTGGLGSIIATEFTKRNFNVPHIIKAFPDEFIPHGTVRELMHEYGLDAEAVAHEIERRILH